MNGLSPYSCGHASNDACDGSPTAEHLLNNATIGAPADPSLLAEVSAYLPKKVAAGVTQLPMRIDEDNGWSAW
jgi:hypothetical protein